MSDVVIRVENLGKRYAVNRRAGGAPYRTLRDSVGDGVRSLGRRWRGGTSGGGAEEFWALDGVSFDVARGAVVGVLGRNGAGKSTLLKVLSRITEPTVGRVTIDGRVASLLEVGTGFHPELTGRENVFLNASILGMTRAEVRGQFDEIVAFAEVEKFLDTPVKRYSSGMYMRLAFAVAAHLRTEILVVDEVLAVGDAAFQKKVVGKMGDVAAGGRTVLFVSHNLSTMLTLCNEGLLLEAGRVRSVGAIRKVAQDYLASDGTQKLDGTAFRGPLQSVRYEQVTLNHQPLGPGAVARPSDELVFRVRGRATEALADFRATFSLFCQGVRLVTLHDTPEAAPLAAGPFELSFTVPAYFLRPGEYALALGGRCVGRDDWFWGTDLAVIQVSADFDARCDRDDHGLVNLPARGTRQALAEAGA